MDWTFFMNANLTILLFKWMNSKNITWLFYTWPGLHVVAHPERSWWSQHKPLLCDVFLMQDSIHFQILHQKAWHQYYIISLQSRGKKTVRVRLRFVFLNLYFKNIFITSKTMDIYPKKSVHPRMRVWVCLLHIIISRYQNPSIFDSEIILLIWGYSPILAHI